MIDACILKNGKLRLILSGGDDIDGQVLKLLNGATCRLVEGNYKLGEKNLAGCLMIEVETSKAADNEYTAEAKAQLNKEARIVDMEKVHDESRPD